MLAGPPPKFHETRDILAIAAGDEAKGLVAVVDGTIVRAHKHAAGARKGG